MQSALNPLFSVFHCQWTMVLYPWYISYARHILTRRDDHSRCLVHVFTLRYAKVLAPISSCVLYLLLSWTWSWPVSQVHVIYYAYTHTLSHTHLLCSKQSGRKRNRLGFFPPDKLWRLNFFVLWPKVTDQRLWGWLKGLLFQLWRCHSIFNSCLHYSLHSAILSWKK